MSNLNPTYYAATGKTASRGYPPAHDLAAEISSAGLQVPSVIADLADVTRALSEVDPAQDTSGLHKLLLGLVGDPGVGPEQRRETAIGGAWELAYQRAAAGELQRIVKQELADLARETESVLGREAAGLIEQARPRFDAAIAEMAEVVAVLGPAPTPKEVPTDEERDAWKRRAPALRECKAACEIVRVLYGRPTVVDFLDVDPESGIDLGTYRQAEQLFTEDRGDFALLLDAGFFLTLNYPADAAAIEASVTRQQQELDQAAAKAEAEDAEQARREAEGMTEERQQALANAERLRG